MPENNSIIIHSFAFASLPLWLSELGTQRLLRNWLVSCCCGTWAGHASEGHAGIEGALCCTAVQFSTRCRRHAQILLCMALCGSCCPGTSCRKSVLSRSPSQYTRVDPSASAAAAAVVVLERTHWSHLVVALLALLREEGASCRSILQGNVPWNRREPLQS